MNNLPQFVALALPGPGGGMQVQQAMVTGAHELASGMVDPEVHDNAGALARVDLMIFPPLQAPHPAAGVILYDGFASARAACAAHAEKGIKFVCAYVPAGFVSAGKWVEDQLAAVREATRGDEKNLSQLTAHLDPAVAQAQNTAAETDPADA